MNLIMNTNKNFRYRFGSMIPLLFVMFASTAGSRIDRLDLVGSYISHHPTFSMDQKPRICQIYSRITKKHIQILPTKKVVAKGADGDEYALLEKTSITFGVVTIRGIKSRRYLCMSKRGKLLARKKLAKDGSCYFIENITAAFWTSFENQRHEKWYIGFKRNKRPKRGRKTRENQDACNFLIRSPESEDDEIKTVPAHMQELFENLKRTLIRKSTVLTRKRRHRLQTENPINDSIDEMMDTLPSWAKQPPHKESPETVKTEWMIRVESLINKLDPPSPKPNPTPSSYDVEAAGDARRKHRSAKSRRRSKGSRSRRSRSGRKRKARPRPTFSPSGKKMADAAMPKTPLRQKDETPAILATVASPSFANIRDRVADDTDIGANEPDILLIDEPDSGKRTHIVNSIDSEFSKSEHVSRDEIGTGSSFRSRRRPQTGKASHHMLRADV